MVKVAAIHPDLGIGGAERLFIDLVHAVMKDYEDTTVWTSHFDPNHCFSDTKDLKIEVRGSKIPRNIFGFFHIILSLISNFWVVVKCMIESNADIYILDAISAWVWLIRIFRPKAKIIFYCHFPDLRLASHKSLIRRIYRFPFDFIEKVGIRSSHIIYVNSKFTQGVVNQEFGIDWAKILYPCVDTSRQTERKPSETPLFVSLNRYERKKDHALAIKALAIASKELPDAKLVIAGGYDDRVEENVEHYKELVAVAEAEKVSEKVEFKRSISDDEKWALIASATAVVYTPQNEHFGIIPIEAENAGTPVIACNSGGPLETCATDGCFICEPVPEAFAAAMGDCWRDSDHSEGLRANAKRFGHEAFHDQLIADIHTLLQ